MNDRLTLEVFYPHPPERVWKALTDPKELGQWLMSADFEPLIGLRFRFEAPRLRVQGAILEVKEPEKLRYTWDDGEAGSPSEVTWTLEPKDGGTLLRLEHEAVEESYVLLEATMNWRHALQTRLSGLLRQPVPIVFVEDEEEENQKPRAGFRQDVNQTSGGAACR